MNSRECNLATRVVHQDQFSWFGPRGFMTSADYPYNIVRTFAWQARGPDAKFSFSRPTRTRTHLCPATRAVSTPPRFLFDKKEKKKQEKKQYQKERMNTMPVSLVRIVLVLVPHVNPHIPSLPLVFQISFFPFIFFSLLSSGVKAVPGTPNFWNATTGRAPRAERGPARGVCPAQRPRVGGEANRTGWQ